MLNRKKVLFSAFGLFLFLGGIFLFNQTKAEDQRAGNPNENLEKPIYVEGEVLVEFKEDKIDLAEDRGLEHVASLESKKDVIREEKNDIKSKNIALFTAEEGQTTEELIEDLRDDSRVESVQPNYLYYPLVQEIPWGVDDYYGVKGQGANDSGYTGDGVVVAVIDTGVYYDHIDLDANLWSPAGDNCYIDGVLTAGGCPNHGYDFSSNDNDPDDARAASHGTHVSGTIAAEDNDVGVVGVAPDAEIMVIKAIYPDVSGAATTNSLVRSMNFAKDNGADIVNMSLGHYHQSSLRSSGDTTSFDDYFRESIEEATAAGVLTIAASGNDSLSIYGYPAGFSDVVSVGAINMNDEYNNPSEDMSTRLSYFSNYGNVDVVAPGYQVNSTTGDGNYSGATWAGTSMACPHVAGVAALIKEKYTTATPAQIKQILQTTATDLGDTGRDQYFGSGLVNAEAAVGVLSNNILLETNWAEDNDTDEPSQYLPTLPADGTSTTKLRATVANSSGVPVSGVTVNFSTDLGTLSASSATTDASGQVSVILTAAGYSGTAMVTASTDDYSSVTAEVSMASILLVSDTAEPYRGYTATNISWFYTQTLENLGYNFVRWETYSRDMDDWVGEWGNVVASTPSVEYMQKFDLVIWYTGDWPLYSQEIVYDYLAAGGNLIMTGQDAGYYYNAGTVTDNGLYADYLKASYISDGAVTDTSVTGLDILDGVDLALTSRYSSYGFGAAAGVGGGLYPDHITPDSNATALAEYSSGAGDAGLRYYNGTTRVIYLPWSFDTITYQANRETVMQNLTESILPLETVVKAQVKKTSKNAVHKINAKSEDEVTVRVDFSDEPTTGIVYVEISDGTNTVSAYQAVDIGDVTQTLEGIDVTSLDNGTITVKAANAYSPESASLTSGTSATKYEVMSKPTNLRTPTKKRKVRTVRVKWDEVQGADYYKVNLRSKAGKQIKTFTSVSNEYKDLKKKYTKSNYAMKFRVKACTNSYGCSSYSDYDNFRTLPAKVSGLKIVRNSDQSVTVSWDEERGKGITYRIKVMDYLKSKLKTYNTTKTSKIVPQVGYHYNYKIKVRAKYNDNNIGRWSNIKLYDLW